MWRLFYAGWEGLVFVIGYVGGLFLSDKAKEPEREKKVRELKKNSLMLSNNSWNEDIRRELSGVSNLDRVYRYMKLAEEKAGFYGGTFVLDKDNRKRLKEREEQEKKRLLYTELQEAVLKRKQEIETEEKRTEEDLISPERQKMREENLRRAKTSPALWLDEPGQKLPPVRYIKNEAETADTAEEKNEDQKFEDPETEQFAGLLHSECAEQGIPFVNCSISRSRQRIECEFPGKEFIWIKTADKDRDAEDTDLIRTYVRLVKIFRENERSENVLKAVMEKEDFDDIRLYESAAGIKGYVSFGGARYAVKYSI